MKLFVYSMREYDELAFFEKFCGEYGVEFGYTTQTPCLENVELAKGYDVVDIITTIMDKPMIDAFHAAGIRCISSRTIGYDHIDTEYAHTLGMGVTHVTYNPASVADYTIMLMLMGCRKAKHIMERAAIQDYTLKGKIGREFSDCTVGVIGREKAEYVSLDRLIRESDIITLHAPATDDNYHMIDTQAIQKMKDGVIIINCARGALIDTDALIEGIENGKVGFAGLDVVEHESGLYYFNRMGEPLGNPKLAILRSYSNVVVTPHTAFYTDEAVSNMAENSIIGAMKFISGEHSSFEVR